MPRMTHRQRQMVAQSRILQRDETSITIQLGTPGLVTVISTEDEDLSQYLWFAQGGGKPEHKHAARRDGLAFKAMHREILERMIGGPIPEGMECDHINRNPLDNRRENLRLATRSGNNQNRRGWGKHGHKGVSFYKSTGKWTAHINIGTFDTKEEAATAWEKAATLLRSDLTPF